jgi:HK97 family phage portal protein
VLISDGSSVSLADYSPQPQGASYYQPAAGLPLVDAVVHYGAIYRRQLWPSVLVNKLAYAAARLPIKAYTRTASGGRDPASDTPYGRLLARPNDLHDPFFFWLWTASTFEIYGEAMWWKDRGGLDGPPVQLWPVHPANVVVYRAVQQDIDAGRGRIVGELIYRLWTSQGYKFMRGADVVHFRSYNPHDMIRGLSRMEPLRQTLLNEDAARRATTSFWTRGARPGYTLSHPGNLSEDAARRLKFQFDAAAGGPDRTGSTVVLEEGMTPTKLDLSNEEAQYIQTRKLNREEACAAWDVPPPVVHILDHATFSNITEQMRSMYRDTMAPRLGLYESVLQSQLALDFDLSGNTYAEFLMDEVLRGDFEARMAAYSTGVNFGITTPAEVRGMENLPDLGPNTHKLFINSTMAPLDDVSEDWRIAKVAEAATAADVPVPTKAIDADVIRKVMGRMSRVKSLAEVDPAALTAGLNGSTEAVLAALDASVMADDTPTQFADRLRAQEVPQ